MLRRFGIELEMFHGSRSTSTSQYELPVALEAINVRARSASYSGQNYTVWQVKSDGSIRPSRNAHHDSGVEVVSRILPGDETGIAEARKVADLLDAQGYRVNASTGFHVHLDCSDLPLRTRYAVALRWSLMRNEIKTFLPPSRHEGHYTSFLTSVGLSKVQRAVETGMGSWGHGERYTACNLEHVQSRGCIEFRQAAGTLNANKIEYWVRFLNEFVDDTAEIMREIESAARLAPAPAPAPVAPALAIARANQNRFRTGSRSRNLLDLLITDASSNNTGVNADEVCRVTGWSRVNFTDTVWALNNAGVPVQRVRRGIYRLGHASDAPAPTPRPVTTPRANAFADVATKLNRPFVDKLSPPVANWIRERKSVFAEDMGAQ